ncbi:MAG: hypothetical protein Q8S84_09205 [bacterium]|nr:hypothetical protein [bacterium]MDP3381597.1 hypothetical protein [bacterium]
MKFSHNFFLTLETVTFILLSDTFNKSCSHHTEFISFSFVINIHIFSKNNSANICSRGVISIFTQFFRISLFFKSNTISL